MSLVASSYVHFQYGPVDRKILLSVADVAFDKAELAAREFLPELDVTVAASAEEASLKTRTKVYATAGAIYLGIANFGGFVDGVREIVTLSRRAMDFVIEQVIDSVATPSAVIRRRVDTGLPGKLARLFERVERGELTAQEARRAAERILGQQPQPAPLEMINDLETEIARLARHARPARRTFPVEYPEVPEVRARPLPAAPEPERSRHHRMRADVWIDGAGRRRRRIL